MLRGYARVQAPTERGDATEASLKAASKGTISLAEMGTDMLIAGTPDDCIAGLVGRSTRPGAITILMYTGGDPVGRDDGDVQPRSDAGVRLSVDTAAVGQSYMIQLIRSTKGACSD